MTPETLFSLSGKTALVTGGATGIGRMAAEAMVRAGAHVLVASRKGQACEATAAELNALDAPGSAEGFAGDLSDEAGIDALVDEVSKRSQSLEILMNNAGATWGAPMGQFPYAAWNKVMSVNVAGIFDLTQKLLPLLMKSASDDDPARVINVGSVMGEVPMGDGAYSYSASKAAVIHLSKIMAKELAPYRVTVNALAPGPFVSRMTAFATEDETKRERVGKGVPLGRVGRADDIAGCMLFLCGRGGSYITGAVLPVSGGINVQTAGNIFSDAL
ncbi:NAD(P)-dependent dehydrogenase, short-chain alcohol dehydrogenase family [Ruegeria halocynthiae]|uniref:NAD(P)-dependent dehydrogenase, short-chain alcohol dehydrogenase family n=1 Tax=Ruegeria halocynthiae TaxID=985054 RepID=A0A1H2TDC3_9RHOB|nr:SDR family NAD(P)-dependent oxidoreductase [Ruegeria halocynthiae]SDW41946.1 NAD(P)-dependent dehydrogenase, short-chain alcohol dehydrogenase family [Ruegeria halocynthiae]